MTDQIVILLALSLEGSGEPPILRLAVEGLALSEAEGIPLPLRPLRLPSVPSVLKLFLSSTHHAH
jgi:hypothetical protein